MCYLIEFMNKYRTDEHITITVQKNEDVQIDYLIWKMTSDHDYLGAVGEIWGHYKPLKFVLLFGEAMFNKITIVETIKMPLDCKIDDSAYISGQDCYVNHFFSENINQCPVKCIAIQMRGFRFINDTSTLKVI